LALSQQLSDQQRAFANAVLAGDSPVEAYLKVGYAKRETPRKTLDRAIAVLNLKAVAKYLNEMRARQMAATETTMDQVLEGFKSIAFNMDAPYELRMEAWREVRLTLAAGLRDLRPLELAPSDPGATPTDRFLDVSAQITAHVAKGHMASGEGRSIQIMMNSALHNALIVRDLNRERPADLPALIEAPAPAPASTVPLWHKVKTINGDAGE
jgi:hypothetical protein